MDSSLLIKRPYLSALLSGDAEEHPWTSIDDLKRFYRKLWPQESRYSEKLIRLGGDFDGGYIMPADFDGIQWCFSPGSAGRASFENDLYRLMGIKSFVCDDWSEEPENNGSIAGFTNRLIGYQSESHKTMTIDDWIGLSLSNTPSRASLILQMDIEGGEYPFLMNERAETFALFKYIVIEIHYLHMIHKENAYKFVSAGLDRLLKTHKPVHVHPNDHTVYGSIEGHPMAHCIEVTFELAVPGATYNHLDRDRLPSLLDQPNIKGNRLIAFPRL